MESRIVVHALLVATILPGFAQGKEGFLDIAAMLAEGANNAVEILRAEGEEGLRQAADEITRNCSACHDTYRREEQVPLGVLCV